MSCHRRVTEWTTIIRTHLPQLRASQATVLALWRLGMVLARSCALTAVTVFLAVWLPRKEQTVRQQLREFCDEAAAKRGTPRQALAVEPCFVPLLRWVLSGWQGTQLALALDATTLGLRFTVLAISVVYRGCAMPVAWTIVAANQPHAWRREWLRMLRQLRPAIPRAWTVIVLADRGLYAGWLFRRIVRLGWHPLLRINAGGTFRPDPQATYRPLTSFVPRPGRRWRGTGTAFKGPQRRLRCTWLACWEEDYTAPWLILTDVPPDASEAGWYGLRAWNRTGLYGAQTGGLAVATHPHDRAAAGGSPVAGGGHPVAAERGGRGRGDDSREHPARCHSSPDRAAAVAAGHSPALGVSFAAAGLPSWWPCSIRRHCRWGPFGRSPGRWFR